MSATESLHYRLCLEGAKWLRHTRRREKCRALPCHRRELCLMCYCCKWVTVEIVTVAAENTDVWGFDGFYSTVIEVKTSRADFLADKKKRCRNINEDFQTGNMRWYLCPEGLVRSDELPDGWGLLYWDGKSVVPVAPPKRRLAGCHGDAIILGSIMRREKVPFGIYNYRNNADKNDKTDKMQ